MTPQQLTNLLAYLFDCAWHHEPPAAGSFPADVRSMVRREDATIMVTLRDSRMFLVSVEEFSR